MLKSLSYFNLITALSFYVLGRSNNDMPVFLNGLLFIMLYNWMVLQKLKGYSPPYKIAYHLSAILAGFIAIKLLFYLLFITNEIPFRWFHLRPLHYVFAITVGIHVAYTYRPWKREVKNLSKYIHDEV